MEDIFTALLQAIEEEAFPLFYANSEYRREQSQVLQQLQWLEERLTDEEKAHLETLRRAGLRLLRDTKTPLSPKGDKGARPLRYHSRSARKRRGAQSPITAASVPAYLRFSRTAPR